MGAAWYFKFNATKINKRIINSTITTDKEHVVGHSFEYLMHVELNFQANKFYLKQKQGSEYNSPTGSTKRRITSFLTDLAFPNPFRPDCLARRRATTDVTRSSHSKWRFVISPHHIVFNSSLCNYYKTFIFVNMILILPPFKWQSLATLLVSLISRARQHEALNSSCSFSPYWQIVRLTW
jgi:hypothetical protein